MFGLLLTKRADRDKHWWDDDALVRARNREFEDRLSELVEDYGVTDPRAPQQKDDDPMQGLVTAAVKFGVLPGIALWLIWMMATSLQSDVRETKATLAIHASESRASQQQIADRLEQSDHWQSRMVNLLRIQCVNEAKTSQDRAECLRQ